MYKTSLWFRFSWTLAFSGNLLFSLSGFAVPTRPEMEDAFGNKDLLTSREASVYIYGDPSLGELMPVRVLGAVQRAGMYHISPATDLLTLLSLAGGTLENANLESVKIKRITKGNESVIEIDLEDMVEDVNEVSPLLQDGDTVLIPNQKKIFSDNFMQTFALITGLATIFGTLAVGLNAI